MTPGPQFLTYTPWPGQLNNTRMCFEVALLLAMLTGRTLVLPSGYRRLHENPEEDFRPLHPRDFLSFESLDRLSPPIPHETYEACRRDPKDRAALRFEPGEAVFCYPSIPSRDEAAAARLREFACGRTHFLQLTPRLCSCETLDIRSPALEHFYTFFFFSDPADGYACRRFIRDCVHFPAPLVRFARDVAARLGPYNAAHIRRGDFFEQFPEQALSELRVLESLLKCLRRELPLYVATDDPAVPLLNLLRRHFRVCVAADLSGTREMAPEALACAEQLVCAHAQSFVGTRLSTFSAYITRLRGYVRAQDLGVRFTDGSWAPHWDEAGAPAFSWTNWLRQGFPLWGREYREGWEV